MRATTVLTEPGDTVVDLGAGSGILSFAAAAAGAAKVYAIELDSLLAHALRRSIQANGFSDVVEVIEGDALDVTGLHADVLLAELIDTGLMDEQFVPAMNRMWQTGIVDDTTRLLFQEYRTTLQLIEADDSYYGFTILAPKHEWPFYDSPSAGSTWTPSNHLPVEEPVEVWRHDFRDGPADATVGPLQVDDSPGANAIAISGLAILGDGQRLGAFNSFNGTKVISLDERPVGNAHLAVSYKMGVGLGSFCVEPVIDLRPSEDQTTTPETTRATGSRN